MTNVTKLGRHSRLAFGIADVKVYLGLQISDDLNPIYVSICRTLTWKSRTGNNNLRSLFWEEISTCVTVHPYYVMDVCSRARSIILLPHVVGASSVLVALMRLNVCEPYHWITWSHRTDINFSFLRGKRIQYFSVSA